MPPSRRPPHLSSALAVNRICASPTTCVAHRPRLNHFASSAKDTCASRGRRCDDVILLRSGAIRVSCIAYDCGRLSRDSPFFLIPTFFPDAGNDAAAAQLALQAPVLAEDIGFAAAIAAKIDQRLSRATSASAQPTRQGVGSPAPLLLYRARRATRLGFARRLDGPRQVCTRGTRPRGELRPRCHAFRAAAAGHGGSARRCARGRRTSDLPHGRQICVSGARRTHRSLLAQPLARSHAGRRLRLAGDDRHHFRRRCRRRAAHHASPIRRLQSSSPGLRSIARGDRAPESAGCRGRHSRGAGGEGR